MWTPLPENIEDYVGFVYEITNLSNSKKYIGAKQFWSRRKLPPLKGKKRKRLKIVESDWMAYTGSSNELNADIEMGDKIEKVILKLCKSKWELTYFELKYQMDADVIFKEEYYNGILNVRLCRPSKVVLESYEKGKAI